nr:YbgA family protein [Acetobacterium wieringae]
MGLALAKIPRYSNYINAMMHILGYFSDSLSSGEKTFVLDRFEKYRSGKIPLSVPLTVLKSYVTRYQQDCLLSQMIWSAFSEELISIRSSGKTKRLQSL